MELAVGMGEQLQLDAADELIPIRRHFSVGEIPAIVFEELTRFLGKGAERSLVTFGTRYERVMDLDCDHPMVGFCGAIGYRAHVEFKDEAVHHFVLWDKVPDDEDSVFSARPILELRTAWEKKPGEYEHGKGELITDRVIFDGPPYAEMKLSDPALVIYGIILYRAALLQKDERCTETSFYERHRRTGCFE